MKQKIVIPIFFFFCNALLTIPLVRQLKKHRPEYHITILAGSPAIGDVFRRLSDVENVIVARSGATDLLKTGIALRLQRCAVFLIPAPSRRWQYLLMAACIGARRTIMHAYTDCPSLIMRILGIETVAAQQGLHDVHQNLLLLNVLDPSRTIAIDRNDAPVFPLNSSDHAAAEALLQKAGFSLADEQPVIIHAGSAVTALATAKRWPPAHCNQLLHELRQRTKRPLIVIEGPDEPGLADEVLKIKPVKDTGIIRLGGSLGTSAALLQRAVLYIGSDSGLAHLAATVGTPPVTLFGPADPERMCPFGYRHLVVQARTQTCRACNRYPYQARYPKITCERDYACMRDITSDDILEKALPLLHSKDCTQEAYGQKNSSASLKKPC